jgi:long-subunit fatty acid transport protein
MFVLVITMQTIEAQNRVSIEFKPGIDFPTQKIGDAELNTGFGFEGTLAYRFMPHLSVYGGWGWHKFSSDNAFSQLEADIEETGYTFGFQFIHPLRSSQLDYFLGFGGIYNHLEIENNDGEIVTDSDHGLGWQAEIGIVVSIGKNWSLKPGVRYRSLSREIDFKNESFDSDLTYFEFGIGISKQL